MGLINHVSTSDEHYWKYPKYLRKSEQRLKKRHRSLSKKQKGSIAYDTQRIELARTHEHEANQRGDFLHKLSLWLVTTYSHIAFENLNIPGMVRNRHLAKCILDAGWGNLIRYTAYKSVMLRGNELVRVNPAYSSQDCSRPEWVWTGRQHPRSLSLFIRQRRREKVQGLGLQWYME